MRGIAAVMVVALAGAVGCGKSKKAPAASTSTKPVDEPAAAATPAAAASPSPAAPNPLWELAPLDATEGLVLRAGALARVADAVRVLRADYGRLSGATEALARMDKVLGKGLPVSPLDPAEWDHLGLDFAKPAAVFARGDGSMMVVLPLADRDTFVKAMKGKSEGSGAARVDHIGDHITCKVVMGGHYACATTTDLLNFVGTGAFMLAGEDTRPAALRGDIEWREISRLPGFSGVTAGVVLERGGFTARVHVGIDTDAVSQLHGHANQLVARLKSLAPAGFVRARVSLASLAASAPTEKNPVLDLSPRELLEALSSEAVAHTSAGSPAHGAIEIGLRKPDRVAPLIERVCPKLPSLLPGAKSDFANGHCRGSLAPPPGDLGRTTLRYLDGVPFDASVDGSALVLDLGNPGKTATAPATTPIGDELRDGDWDLAWWGMGILPPETMMAIAESMPPDPTTVDVLWLYMHLRALGMGVRVGAGVVDGLLSVSTQWANPDDVCHALERVFADAIAGKKVSGQVAALAKAHPATPLGESMKNGVAGLLPITAAVGIVAAIAIPAFLKYRARAMKSAAAIPH